MGLRYYYFRVSYLKSHLLYICSTQPRTISTDSVLFEWPCLEWREQHGLNLLKGEIEMMLGTVVHTTWGGYVYSGVSRSGCGCCAPSIPQQFEKAASHTSWGRDAQTGTAHTSVSCHPWKTHTQRDTIKSNTSYSNYITKLNGKTFVYQLQQKIKCLSHFFKQWMKYISRDISTYSTQMYPITLIMTAFIVGVLMCLMAGFDCTSHK